jgi:hypothetical protein
MLRNPSAELQGQQNLETHAVLYVPVCLSGTHILSRPPLNQYGEIGSRYPTNVYDGNRLPLPVLRQKMALPDV